MSFIKSLNLNDCHFLKVTAFGGVISSGFAQRICENVTLNTRLLNPIKQFCQTTIYDFKTHFGAALLGSAIRVIDLCKIPLRLQNPIKLLLNCSLCYSCGFSEHLTGLCNLKSFIVSQRMTLKRRKQNPIRKK